QQHQLPVHLPFNAIRFGVAAVAAAAVVVRFRVDAPLGRFESHLNAAENMHLIMNAFGWFLVFGQT
ncbi:unnamed protein product, partial [Ceratitis capitata]